MRIMIQVALLAILGVTAGCGKGRRSGTDACEPLIAKGEECGTYVVGDFGGSTRAEDVTICTRTYQAFNDHCQELWSGLVDCAVESTCGAGASADCSALLAEFQADCSP